MREAGAPAGKPPADWRRPLTWLAPRPALWLLLLVVGLGALLRGVVWWQARSIYLDEANLLRNCIERGYAGLFQPLRYEQYAPPLLTVLLKAATAAFGCGERAVRLVPLLAGTGALIVFAQLARRWLTPLSAIMATAFVAFGSLYVEFSAAAKQYSTDALVALVLLTLADQQLRHSALSLRATLAWALGGAVVVWLSMPSVFILAGVGAAFGWRYGWPGRTSLPARWQLTGLALAWAASFGAYFLLLLRSDARASNLQQFHDAYFLAFPPRSAADWTLLGDQLRGLVDRAFGKTTLALALAAIGFSVGSRDLCRREPARALLLLLPLTAALAASALHYYSLLARLMLFAMPLLVLVISTGLQPGLQRPGVGLGVVALVLAILGNQQRLTILFGPPFQTDYADVRAGLRYVAAHQQPGDVVFVPASSGPVAYYYQRFAPLAPAVRGLWLQSYHPPTSSDSAWLAADARALAAAGHRRVWFIADQPAPWRRRWAAATGAVSLDTTFFRGYAFRWEAAPRR